MRLISSLLIVLSLFSCNYPCDSNRQKFKFNDEVQIDWKNGFYANCDKVGWVKEFSYNETLIATFCDGEYTIMWVNDRQLTKTEGEGN